MIERLRARNEWRFVSALRQADRALAVTWWTILVLRGLLPLLRSDGALAGGREVAAEA